MKFKINRPPEWFIYIARLVFIIWLSWIAGGIIAPFIHFNLWWLACIELLIIAFVWSNISHYIYRKLGG